LAHVLQPLNGLFPTQDYPALLVGLEAPDDAAVYRLDAERAIISTVDFFPPVVDDAYSFGAIAAANALSDIYAMGGEPLMAINLAAFPDGLDMTILSNILRGGGDKVKEAGAVIAGGHTVSDKEPKYGLAVTGIIHPDRIITKGGAQVGDKLILTKALGTGVITTALKNSSAQVEHVESAVASMTRLNRASARLAVSFKVHGMTDVTGYSLLGHAHEMAHLAGVDFRINYQNLHWLPGVYLYAEQDFFPGGTWRNQDYFEQWVQFDDDISEAEHALLFDPQTSGGLLMATEPEHAEELLVALTTAGEIASVIGDVIPGNGRIHVQK
jgi:selenide, water dikinase